MHHSSAQDIICRLMWAAGHFVIDLKNDMWGGGSVNIVYGVGQW